MAKIKCPLCGTKKAKRTCKIRDGIQICPICCAKRRYEACQGCSYYESSLKFKSEKQSEKHFTTMIDPDIDDECDELMKLVEAGKQTAEAREKMEVLFRKYPNYHTVLFGMGVCCVMQEKHEEGIKFFERAIEIFPYFLEAHFNLAMARIKSFDIAGAVNGLKKIISIGNDSELVSMAKDQLKNLEEVTQKFYKGGLDSYLKNQETFDRAFDAFDDKDYDLARDLFKRVLSVEPKNTQSWGNLGLVYARMGQKTKALECLDKALELDPEYEVAMINKFSVENMAEGERLEAIGESIKYYKDFKSKNKSYAEELLKRWRK